ncbi:MAG TPA: methyltransferase domain-containing protein [Desertimonas sp.]|nr:methyltransferase domain-containing protein [Desertimonas sp.]
MGTTADTACQPTSSSMLDSILRAVAAAGHDVDNLSADVLASVDHVHLFGVPATLRLAAAAEIADDDVVLDVGCGTGGPVRTLATEFGCQLVGVATTPEFCEAAAELNRRSGLDDLIEIRAGTAVDLPCEAAEFTVVWTQHASARFPDKPRMYAEMRRALVSGGRLAFFDVLNGDCQPLHLPVPWADADGHLSLATSDELRAMVTRAGFTIRRWDDVTDAASDYVAAVIRTTSLPSELGAQIVVPDMTERAAALLRNVDEGRVTFIQCVADAV